MLSRGLRIDTSVTGGTGRMSAGASANTRGGGRSGRSITPKSVKAGRALTANSLVQRKRTTSASSSSSTTSMVSPAPSSGSTSSPDLPIINTNAVASTSRVTLNYSTSPSSSSGEISPPGMNDYVLALHDYVPQNQTATCLSFRAGQVIHVLNRDPSGWWDGESEGRRGWFPSNYVTADMGLLKDEDLPGNRWRPGHGHFQSDASTMSVTSWTSTPRQSLLNHKRSSSALQGSEFDSYCPSLMVPLVHAMSVMQTSVRSKRTSHFQPSTASIIVAVRTILSSTECLQRDASNLQKSPLLAQERGLILSTLAALVAQTKKAGEDNPGQEQKEVEMEAMLTYAGQLFAYCRRFLAFATECGIRTPSSGSLHTDETAFSEASVDEASLKKCGGPVSKEPTTSPAMDATPRPTQKAQDQRREIAGTPRAAKSMSDLRRRKSTSAARDVATSQKPPVPPPKDKRDVTPMQTPRHKAEPSVASITSESSYSSSGSDTSSSSPSFPVGPSSAAEVLDALRHSHDQYLSTIAAFIGHAHTHSRSSHASSTGHMYDLVREVVEVVCKLLTIVEAVMRHPDVPTSRLGKLKAAKDGLFNVTSSLAEAVKNLSTSRVLAMTEEEERRSLIRSATGALKAGADCVAAVKTCLTRTPIGNRPFIVELPCAAEAKPALFKSDNEVLPPSAWRGSRIKSPSMGDLPLREVDEGGQELLVQARVSTGWVDGEFTPTSAQSTAFSAPSSSPSSSPTVDTFLPGSDLILQSLSPVRGRNRASSDLLPYEFSPSAVQSPTSPVDQQDARRSRSEHRRSATETAASSKRLHGELPILPRVESHSGDPLSRVLAHDYSLEDVAFNNDGQLVGATLAALVEKMTPHDSIVDPAFSDVFWLTFRLFSSSVQLLEAIIARYNLHPPSNLSQEDVFVWQQRKGMPVRLRISNFIRSWLELHWRRSTDNVVLYALDAFNRDALRLMFPGPAQRIQELIRARTQNREILGPQGDRPRDSISSASDSENPKPIMTKTLLYLLRSKSFAFIPITEFDALEVARQLTIIECNLYCAIKPEDLLEIGQEGMPSASSIRAVTSLSTAITGWVAEGILNEPDMKRRIGLVKLFVKIADRCTSLNNFSTCRSILAALDSSTISRLHQTWMGVPQKTKLTLESLRKLADHARNYHEYRARLRNAVPPAVPFLGLYLTDMTFCREGNPSHRPSPMVPEKKLLNFNKYQKMARIVQDMKRFQAPYSLRAIPEIQQYLHSSFDRSRPSGGDLQDLYRRSLQVEPRRAADAPPTGDVRQLFNWPLRSQPIPGP